MKYTKALYSDKKSKQLYNNDIRDRNKVYKPK